MFDTKLLLTRAYPKGRETDLHLSYRDPIIFRQERQVVDDKPLSLIAGVPRDSSYDLSRYRVRLGT